MDVKVIRLVNGDGEELFISVEIANTDEAIEQGLMHRTVLPDYKGMLFDFKDSSWGGQASFWMKNTDIPLSAAFFNDDGLIVGVYDMTPHDESIVEPVIPCRYGLEVNQGLFQRWHIIEGCKVYLPEPQPPTEATSSDGGPGGDGEEV